MDIDQLLNKYRDVISSKNGGKKTLNQGDRGISDNEADLETLDCKTNPIFNTYANDNYSDIKRPQSKARSNETR
jgi:hypothetical protein